MPKKMDKIRPTPKYISCEMSDFWGKTEDPNGTLRSKKKKKKVISQENRHEVGRGLSTVTVNVTDQ